ncbi:MAG TPA: DHH family phosphoesterase [Halococcus sp.]|nr:DHH family phosphoesterase [Halococcus sp.]
MLSRLVLGCGSVGRTLVSSLGDMPGDVLVLCADEHRIETLRSGRIEARRADPTDPASLDYVDHPIDVVILASDDPSVNRAAATLARETYPEAFVFAYMGKEPTDELRMELETIADRVVESAATAAADLLSRIGEESMRPRRLWRVLRTIEAPLAVVTHDNPDPDAIASALALCKIANFAGCETDICYFGNITHQQNRAMVNLLDLDMRELEAGDIDEYGGLALVDHSRPGVNDQLPEDTPVDVLIDHHPPRAPVEARFVDLRSDVGATSTLLVEYLRRLGIEVDETVATALLYGIRIDTKDFKREVSTVDFEAAAFLLPYVDEAILEQVETPSMSAETLETMARAIKNREVRDSVLLSYIEDLHERDALAQAADQLLDIEGVRTTLVYGIIEGTVYCSGRTRGAKIDLGETLRDAFDQIGSAGGHADMAGAQISLGLLGESDENELSDIVHDVITERFFEALDARPAAQEAHALSPMDETSSAYESDDAGETSDTGEGDDSSGVEPR